MIFGFISFAVNSLIYPALLEWFPGLIPEYNFVNEREDYDRLAATLTVISGVILIFVISHISLRLDNERMEYMISKTDGLYTLAEGARMYYSRYFYADIFASLLIPLPILLLDTLVMPHLVGFLPDGAVSLISIPLEPTRAFSYSVGTIPAYILMAVCFLVSRLASGFRCIDVWRAIWLSDIEYVG